MHENEIVFSNIDNEEIVVEFGPEVPAFIEHLVVHSLLKKGLTEITDLSKAKKWAPKAHHKSKKGGLTEAGRKSYNKATGGHLKPPQPQGGSRKRSFCARNAGQIKMHNIDCRKNPDKRACKARRRWKC
jgi:hypothetical protein